MRTPGTVDEGAGIRGMKKPKLVTPRYSEYCRKSDADVRLPRIGTGKRLKFLQADDGECRIYASHSSDKLLAWSMKIGEWTIEISRIYGEFDKSTGEFPVYFFSLKDVKKLVEACGIVDDARK